MQPAGNSLTRTARTLLLVALAATAYHGLAFWDPRSHGYPAVVGWFFEASDSSPQVIFGIVAVLLFRRRRELREALGGATAPGLGTLGLAAGVWLHLSAQWLDAPDFMVVSLGLVGLGTGLLLGGRPLARELAGPLALLVFALPLPGALHNLVVYPFQLASAGFADVVLRAIGFDVVHFGDMLGIDGREFEVIETCSGLRSILTLALLAGAWAVYFRCSARHTVWLLAASPLIAFLTNGIRVMVLVVDPRAEVQESHTAQGIVMFVVGSIALSLVDRALLRLVPSRTPALPVAPERPAPALRDRRRALVPLALAVLALASVLLPTLRPVAPELRPAAELPREIAGWRAIEGPERGHFLGNVHFTQRSNFAYVRGGESVWAFLGWDDRRLRTRSLLSEKNAIRGPGWEIERRGQLELEPGGVRMESVLARHFADRSLNLYAYRGTGGVFEEVLREALALDQPGSPFARPGRASLLRLSVLVRPGPDGVREAEERLRSFFAELAPVLAW